MTQVTAGIAVTSFRTMIFDDSWGPPRPPARRVPNNRPRTYTREIRMSKTIPKAAQPELPPPLTCLADAPMFIDADQVARVYDAVVRPDNKEGKTTIQLTEGEVKKWKPN